MNYQLAIDTAIAAIKTEEDIYKVLPDGRIQAYWDSKGKVWTIGWGSTYYEDGAPVKEGDIITRKRADDLLRLVVTQKEKEIRPAVTARLNENQYAALISIAYNAGEGFLKGSNLLKLINAGAPKEEIEQAFSVAAVTAKGKFVQGLYNRRMNELRLFYTETKRLLTENPEVSWATGLTILALAGYYLYRATKLKK